MNRRGFGLLAMLGFCCFLGICIMVSVLSYQDLKKRIHMSWPYETTSSEIKNYRMENDYSGVTTLYVSVGEYQQLEEILKKGAETYMEMDPISTENKMIITFRTLKSKKIIDNLYDSNGHMCSGYVIYYPISKTYEPYLSCGGYHSPNYLSRLD